MSEQPPIASSSASIGPPEAAGSRSLAVKTVLTVVEGIVLGVLVFAFGNFYLQLSKSQEVRWTSGEIECLNPPTCSSGRLGIKVYKLGGKSEPHARLVYAVLNPATYQLVDKSVQKYDVSLLNLIIPPNKDQALGTFASLPADDPENNPSTAFDFDVAQLEAGQVYEITILLRSASSSPTNVGRFEIRDASNHKIDYQGLSGRDRLRLYLVEGIVLATVLFALIGFLVIGATWGGWRFFRPLLRIIKLHKT